MEIEWKYILALDPAESKRPKPSPDAKLLPEDLHHDTDVNADNRKDGVPDVGDIFHSNEEQKWAEWNAATTREVRNPFQKKIEFSKPERIWYYLGRTSTEAKAQYTHDPDKTVHNPKSNFLDTVKPPPKPTVIPDRRSFPASYPSGVNFHALNGAMAAQRQQLQPSKSKQPIQMDRPYMYKPKQAISSILNPQSPVTPQAPQYGSDASKPGSNPTKFQAYSPPMQTAPSTAPPTFTQPVFTVPKAYQQPPNPSTTAKDPLRAGWPYQSATYTQVHGRSSPRADARSPHAPPTKPRTPSFSNGLQRPSSQSGQAPVANMLARPSSSAASPPSNSHSARPSLDRSTLSHEKQPWVEMSKAEYLERIKHIPYLLNAHLRRPPYYRSPYTYTGFSPEWLPRSSGSQSNSTIGYSASPYSSAYTLPPAPSAITAPTAPVAPMAPMGSASQNYMQSRSLPATIPGPYSQALQQQSKPQAQYSTPQQFQQQVNQETPGSGYNGQLRNLERMLQQLGDYKRTPGVNGTHASPNSPSSGAGAALGQDAISSLSYGTPNDRVGTPMKNTSSGGSFLNGHASWRTGSPMRPEYSPLSDVGQESSRPTTRDNMPSLQSLESWRT